MNVLFLTFGLGLSVLGYVLLLPLPDTDTSRFAIAGSEAYIRGVILYVTMLIGILAKGLHDLFDNDKVGIREVLRLVWRSREFRKAMLVSPLVYFGVYKIAQHQSDTLVAILLAFQNGFFWQSVMQGNQRGSNDDNED